MQGQVQNVHVAARDWNRTEQNKVHLEGTFKDHLGRLPELFRANQKQ